MYRMLMTDGALRVLVGRLSVSHTDSVKPVQLLFNDASGSIICFVSSFSLLPSQVYGTEWAIFLLMCR